MSPDLQALSAQPDKSSRETVQEGVTGRQRVGLRKDQRQCWHHGVGKTALKAFDEFKCWL